MSQFILLVILVGIVLGYVSFLLYVSLASRGVLQARIYRVLIELWATFLLIMAILALITFYLGPAPSGSLASELTYRLSRWDTLSWAQQAVIITGVVLAVLLFAHFLWSLRTLQARPIQPTIPTDEGDTE